MGRIVACVAAALAGGGLMGGVAYTHGSDIALGAAAGAALLGALGYAVAAGVAGPATLCGVLVGLVVALLGPGVDDFSGSAVVPLALVGGVVGHLIFGGRRRGAEP